jgi:hypothetical protein
MKEDQTKSQFKEMKLKATFLSGGTPNGASLSLRPRSGPVILQLRGTI